MVVDDRQHQKPHVLEDFVNSVGLIRKYTVRYLAWIDGFVAQQIVQAC